ncbi:MAG: type II toxin-antitoxin system TacA family antitoxin [Thermoguttaceae bacterium]
MKLVTIFALSPVTSQTGHGSRVPPFDIFEPHGYIVWQIATCIGLRSAGMASAGNDARLNFRLPPELKQIIEQAAAHTGQTVSDYAVSILVQNARRVIEEHDRTELSRRDRDAFVKLLDDETAKPNRALAAAARKYKRHWKEQ